MAIFGDDYGRAALAGPSNGVPRNFSATNNGSLPGPSYSGGTSADWFLTGGVPPFSLYDGSLAEWARDQMNLMNTAPFATQWDQAGATSQQQGPGADQGPGGGGGSAPGGGLPWWAKAAAVAGPAVAGRALSGNGTNQMSPEMQQLLALALRRIQDQEPLFQAINQQALAGLPNRR